MSKKVRIYGAGGAGCNLVGRLFGEVGDNVSLGILDTSRSNLRSQNLPDDMTYIVKDRNMRDKDGSGQHRAENLDDILDQMKQVIVNLPPEDYNIVVFGTAGGTGSVAGPVLIGELLENGHNVVGVAVANNTSNKAVENNLGCLRTLEAQAEEVGRPVVITYTENRGGDRQAADEIVDSNIRSLLMLLGEEHDELDRTDIKHFLDFSKSGHHQPQLSTLHMLSSVDKVNDVQPVSVASLYASKNTQIGEFDTDYHTVGFGDISAVRSGDAPVKEIHFAISVTELMKAYDYLNERVSGIRKSREARVQRRSLTEGAKVTRGVVLD